MSYGKINQKTWQINTRAIPEYERLSKDCPSFFKILSISGGGGQKVKNRPKFSETTKSGK